MICYQDVGVNHVQTFDLGLSETFQEETEIIVGEKSSGAIVSMLDNVMMISRNFDLGHPAMRYPVSRCHQTCRERIAG